MELYCDYEALEFNNKQAIKEKIYPYYLDSNLTDTSLCPIYFSASNVKGKVVFEQNVYERKISFIDFLNYFIEKNRNNKYKNITVNFHNIKYDFRIIIYELFYNGFKQVFNSDTLTYKGNYISEYEKSFSIIGENLSKFIAIRLQYKEFTIYIKDTMSILNNAQNKILKDFGYKSKVDIDWNKITIENLQANISDIKARCNYDVSSLALCIERFKKTFLEKFNGQGSTASSMSLDAYKYYLCNLENIETDRENKDIIFRKYYPIIENEIEKEINLGCYHGGICTLNENHVNKILKDIQMIDINSSYPYAMTKPLPIGIGKEIQGFTDVGYSEYIIYIDFIAKGIPFVRCHSEYRARYILGLEPPEKIYTRSQFPKNFQGYICINSVDLKTLLKYYEVNVLEFKKGFNYETTTIISNFIKPIYEERKKVEGVQKQAIKLLLNSLYGKFAQDLTGICFNYLDIYNYDKVLVEDNNTFYKPLASAVTSYARENLINTMYLIGDNFIYCDTDSIYFKNVKETMKIFNENNIIHKNNLGKWATEYDKINKGKFLSKKNYLVNVTKDNKTYDKLTCVGLSHKYHNQINFDNFVLNSKEFKIQKMVNIYGGKAMRNTSFIIKERNFL